MNVIEGQAKRNEKIQSDFFCSLTFNNILNIIIMLILVAVSISIALNTGLFDNAGKATQKWKAEQGKEQELASGKVTIGNKSYASIQDYMTGEYILPEGAGERFPITGEYSDGSKTAIIPEGFTVSKIPSETTVDEGLVIYDIPEEVDITTEDFWTETVTIEDQEYPKVQTEYNQFVWIPVTTAYVTVAKLETIISEDKTGTITDETKALQSLVDDGIYPMAVKINDTDYRGVLYDFTEGTNTVSITVKEFSSTDDYTKVKYNREPAYLTNTSYADGSSLNSIGITQSSLQSEFNFMIESIYNNGGFYVARYELVRFSNNKYGSKRGHDVALGGSAPPGKWYGLYRECKGMYNKTTDSVQSTMISGTQWDQIMIWMKEVKNTKDASKYYILDSSYMGNYATDAGGKGEKMKSGYLDSYSIKNVFDLGGNLYEWTLEAADYKIRTLRGGVFSIRAAYSPRASRNFANANNPYSGLSNNYSTRCTLYIK